MLFDFRTLSANQRYHLITQTLTPRPIAWILTRNVTGSFNLAPFSYFTALCSDPALLVVSIGDKADKIGKDTKENLKREQECVLHIPSMGSAMAVNASAASLPYEESELNICGLDLSPFSANLPRISEAKVAMHCKLYDSHTLGESSFTACYLEVINVYIDDTIVSKEGKHTYISSDGLQPLGRLGGNDFAQYGGKLTIKRPA